MYPPRNTIFLSMPSPGRRCSGRRTFYRRQCSRLQWLSRLPAGVRFAPLSIWQRLPPALASKERTSGFTRPHCAEQGGNHPKRHFVRRKLRAHPQLLQSSARWTRLRVLRFLPVASKRFSRSGDRRPHRLHPMNLRSKLGIFVLTAEEQRTIAFVVLGARSTASRPNIIGSFIPNPNRYRTRNPHRRTRRRLVHSKADSQAGPDRVRDSD